MMGRLIGFVLFAFIGMVGGISIATDKIRTEAVERGYAMYSPTTGKWQWKDINQLQDHK